MSEKTKEIPKQVVVEKPLLLRGEAWMDIIWTFSVPAARYL